MTTDVTSLASALDAAADRLEDAAQQVRRHAEMMRKDNDVTRAAEAASTIAQSFGQCRLDLFVTRSLRAVGTR